MLRVEIIENGTKITPDGFGDHSVALRSGMNAIGLVQFGNAGYTLEQKRNQGALIGAGLGMLSSLSPQERCNVTPCPGTSAYVIQMAASGL